MKFVALIDGEEIPVEIQREAAGYRIRLRDRTFHADLVSANPVLRSLRLEDGTQYLFLHHRDGARHQISFGSSAVHLDLHDPLAMRRSRHGDETAGGDGTVRAIMPGRVVRVHVEEGAEVAAGDGLLVVEAMKMENEITAPRAGRVAQIHVGPGTAVESGAELVTIE